MKNQLRLLLLFLPTMLLLTSCENAPRNADVAPANWAEKLGFPPGKKVVILHADDIGMCPEANVSARKYLENDHIQSCAVMMPCPAAREFIDWASAHPEKDVGLHLTLTSEWKTYRWPGLTAPEDAPGLLDSAGMLWHEVIQVVQNASAEEVEKEVRAQVEQAHRLGLPARSHRHPYGHPLWLP